MSTLAAEIVNGAIRCPRCHKLEWHYTYRHPSRPGHDRFLCRPCGQNFTRYKDIPMSTGQAAELLQAIRWYGQAREDQDCHEAGLAIDAIERIIARLIDLP